jgi:hypothetical protein
VVSLSTIADRDQMLRMSAPEGARRPNPKRQAIQEGKRSARLEAIRVVFENREPTVNSKTPLA